MAIIVDKDKKRRDIALSCKELLLDNGIESLTISQIAQNAGVGKGTIYEYFINKEDIVFEIIRLFIIEHEKKFQQRVDSSSDIRQKLFHFLYLLFEDDESKRHIMIYKEFLAISITREPKDMLDFSEECHNRFKDILNHILMDEEGINIEISSLLIFSTGLIIDSRLSSCDVKREIDIFLDMLLGSKSKKEESIR